MGGKQSSLGAFSKVTPGSEHISSLIKSSTNTVNTELIFIKHNIILNYHRKIELAIHFLTHNAHI